MDETPKALIALRGVIRKSFFIAACLWLCPLSARATTIYNPFTGKLDYTGTSAASGSAIYPATATASFPLGITASTFSATSSSVTYGVSVGSITVGNVNANSLLKMDSTKQISSATLDADYIGPTSTGSYLTLGKIGSPQYYSLQEFANFAMSPGQSSGGNITDAGSALVNVSSGTGFIKALDVNQATNYFIMWPSSSNISVGTGFTSYIGVKYNAGVPVVSTKATDTWDLDTEFPLGVVINEAGRLYISSIPWVTSDNMANILERFDSDNTVSRDNRSGGIVLSNTGTRNVAVTSGQLLSRMGEFAISAIDTSASGRFDLYYRDGATGFTKVSAQTQWNNTNYDDGDGTLGAIPALGYASIWFYLMIDGSLAAQYGRATYTTLAGALNDAVPSSAPDRIVKGGLLIGRFVIQAAGSSPTTTQSAFGTSFTASGVTSFSDLAGTVGDTQIAAGAVDLDGTEVAGILPGSSVDTLNLSSNLPGGSTSYIRNTSSLQSGATFYTSTGTVNFFTATSGTFSVVAISSSIAVPLITNVSTFTWQSGPKSFVMLPSTWAVRVSSFGISGTGSTNDPDFIFSLPANTTWFVSGVYHVTTTTTGFRMGIDIPANGSLRVDQTCVSTGAISSMQVDILTADNSLSATTCGHYGNGAITVRFDGILATNGGGTVQFIVGNSSSGAGPGVCSILQAGSRVTLGMARPSP